MSSGRNRKPTPRTQHCRVHALPYSLRPAGSTASIVAGLFFIAAGLAIAQTSAVPTSEGTARVVITGFVAGHDDPVAEKLASTIADSIALIVRQTGEMTVEQADFLAPWDSIEKATIYYRQSGAKIGIWGSVRQDPGGAYAVTVNILDVAGGSGPRTVSRSITDLFSAFDISDQLALEVASNVVGHTLVFGTITIGNAAALHQFGVYSDGHLVARDTSTIKVLTGQHTIIVAIPGSLGDQPVESFDVDLSEGSPLTLKLNDAALTTAKSPSDAASSAPGAGGSASGASGSSSGAAEPTTASAVGRLTIRTEPSLATVFLDTKIVGTTPLNLYGVAAGKYTLRIERPLFKTQSRVVTVSADELTTSTERLEVDNADPRVANALRAPGATSFVSGSWTLTQGSFMLADLLLANGNYLAWSTGGASAALGELGWIPDGFGYLINVLGVHAGVLSTGDFALAVPLYLAESALATVITADRIALSVWAPYRPGSTPPSSTTFADTIRSVIPTVGYIGMGVSMLADIALSPLATQTANRHILDTIAATGAIPRPSALHEHRIVFQTGGGTLAAAGWNFPVIRDYLSVEALAGASALSFNPLVPVVSASARAVYSPYGVTTGSVRPIAVASAGIETSFRTVGGFAGFGVGSEVLFRGFDLFSLSELRYDVDQRIWSGVVTFGGRL